MCRETRMKYIPKGCVRKMDYMATGMFYFVSEMPDDELTSFSYRIWELAAKHKLGIFMHHNIPGEAAYKVRNGVPACRSNMPFSLSDSPWYGECDELFGNIGYYGRPFSMADISSSGLPRLQLFFEDVIGLDMISHIFFETSFHHGWPAETTLRTIRADEFCQTIIDAPLNDHDFPIVGFTIVKNSTV